jgi:putative transposase
MPYRITPLINENFYHIFNRGVEKRVIFLDEKDFTRFLKTIFYYQLKGPRPRFSRYNPFIHNNLSSEKIVDIVVFCLMPNHFHLLLKQVNENGISEFLRKVSNSYTRYFNTKYRRVGPLFQGQFKAVLVETNEQSIHVSRYIHLNPLVSNLVKDLKDYIWSSYKDYLEENNSLVNKGEILSFFSSVKSYQDFVMDHEAYARSLELIKHQLLEEVEFVYTPDVYMKEKLPVGVIS